MSADSFAAAFVAVICAVLFLIYFGQVQLRRHKYERIAAELGAEYLSQGLLKSGKIAGASQHRKYTIENKSGFHGSMWSVFEMSCANQGIPLHIHGRFFKDFPNWKYAFTEGERTERVFATHLTVHGGGIPLDEKHKPEVQELFQEFAIADGTFLGRGVIMVEQDNVRLRLPGIVKKLEEIQEALSVLARLAERIEAEPIVS